MPFVIMADGPALRPDSQLAEDLRGLGRWQGRPPPEDREDFGQWREFWEGVGVFTLADQFGDDGNKGGEFEAFLEQVDPALLVEAKRAGGRSKPRRGAFFAVSHPEPPQEVMDVYVKMAAGLKLGGAEPGPAAAGM